MIFIYLFILSSSFFLLFCGVGGRVGWGLKVRLRRGWGVGVGSL